MNIAGRDEGSGVQGENRVFGEIGLPQEKTLERSCRRSVSDRYEPHLRSPIPSRTTTCAKARAFSDTRTMVLR